MGVSTSGCPVPLEQQPMNEYRSLQESCFFGWATRDLKTYLTRMALLWSGGGLIALPIARESFGLEESLGKCLLGTAAGATLGLVLILVRLYLGWSYVCDRLLSKAVVYEETGWYDGQSWQKPAEDLAKDQLVGIYDVRPILRRLRYTFAVLGLLLIGGGCLWRWV